MKRSSIQQLKLRTRCARCRKLGHWARECSEGNRGQSKDERYDRRASRSGENSTGFITLAKPTERRPFFLGGSWTFVALDPGEVLWDTGAQEGLVGKQQLDNWCKLLAEHCLQVEWSQEKPESARGIGGTTKPIGVVYVPVGLAVCNGIIRFTVVEQDVPPLLPVEIMRTLQASLDLTDDGDKSDLPSEESPHCALCKADTRSFVPTNLILMRLNGMEHCGRSNSGNASHILRHLVSGNSDVDSHGAIGGHPYYIATTGATRDEGQEEQCCESSGGSVGARQSLTERQPGNPWKKAIIHRLRSRREAKM